MLFSEKPTKGQREDAVVLAKMIIEAYAQDKEQPGITPERVWLLAATLRYIIRRHGLRVID